MEDTSAKVWFEGTISSNIFQTEETGSARNDSSLDCSQFDPSQHKINSYLLSSGLGIWVSMTVLNLAVIFFMVWSITRSRKLNVPKVLVLVLAMTDLGYALFSILPQVLRYIFGYCGAGGAKLCQASACLSSTTSIMSMLVVLTMSLERFCALKLPFRYEQLFSMSSVWKIIATLFAYSVFCAVLPFLGMSKYTFGSLGCDFDRTSKAPSGIFYTYFRTLQGLLLMPVILGVNLTVLLEINRMSRVAPSVSTQPDPAAGDGSDKKAKGGGASALQKRFAVLTILASIAFITCNTPYLIRTIQYERGVEKPMVPDYVVKRMFISNSIVNPCLSLFFYLSSLGFTDIFRCFTKKNDSASRE